MGPRFKMFLIYVLFLSILFVIANAGCSFDSPCPTSCPNGYEPNTAHTMDGCTVYCTTEPVNGQCQEGGKGCESSCVPTVTNSTEPVKI